MQDIEPFHRWEKYYVAAQDARSPFYRRRYDTDRYTHDIYGYFIHPLWDYIGSETLYIKILFADYAQGYAILECMGEWNDTLHNDVMHLKRNILDKLSRAGIKRFVLIGENVLNFHGSDDCYYEEWYEDIEEDGWIAALGFRDFVLDEWRKYHLDWYIHFGGTLEITEWRTYTPQHLCQMIDGLIRRRLGPAV